jgi:hypothetical protein
MSEELKACNCSEKHNLPMGMCNEEMTRHWVECDFCGKCTSSFKTEDESIDQWRLIADAKEIEDKLRAEIREVCGLIADIEHGCEDCECREDGDCDSCKIGKLIKWMKPDKVKESGDE